MADDMYKLAGTVRVPEDKKPEFNRKVLEVLYRGGVRKTEEIIINGAPITVVKRAVPDKDGMVYFDYSIFEKKVRAVASFNTETGELDVTDRGYSEYGVIMNLVMVLQQAYSGEPCFLTEDGKPINVAGYLAVLYSLLGEKTDLENGVELWPVMEFFHKSSEYDDLCSEGLWNTFTQIGTKGLNRQVEIATVMFDDPIRLTDEVSSMDIASIRDGKRWQQKEYLYRTMLRYKDDKDFALWFKTLLQCELDERKQLAEGENDYGIIAELSLRFSAQSMANIYGKARGESFWNIWDALDIKGYSTYQYDDEEDKTTDAPDKYYPLYKPMQRDSEDEFLEYWNGENLHLSDELLGQIEKWKDDFAEVKSLPDMDVEQELYNIIYEMYEEWDCCYVDKTFIDEFLEHKDNGNYKKLLAVLINHLNMGIRLFPELTKEQAKKWVLHECRSKNNAILMSAYISLMTNHSQRQKIFGV